MDACILHLAGRPVNEKSGAQAVSVTDILFFTDKSPQTLLDFTFPLCYHSALYSFRNGVLCA
jgi:hypothetical protein